MSERMRSEGAKYQTNPTKMPEGDLGTRKTLFVIVIVVGCFAVLWPKVFYPMLVGPSNQRMKPSNLDKGCCDVIADIDVDTIKIMTELCRSIIQHSDQKPLKGQQMIARCRTEVLSKCGIDISAVLQEQVRLGRTFKQIVDEVRSSNGSLCLKYNYGISPWSLGVTHRVAFNVTPDYVRQERPTHLRPEMLHPALREKGRAIVEPYSPGKKPPKIIEGRPGPVPGIRPPLGAGAGHIVPPQKGLNSMGIIMPIYTIGIVIFFSYTLLKLMFKKKPDGPGGGLYPPVERSMSFRKEVFEAAESRPPRQSGSSKLVVNAMSALLDEVDQELEARRKASEVASQKEPTPNGTLLPNGSTKPEHEQPSVKVLGMEMTASCEGGERWSRPESPVIPNTPPPPPEPLEPPQEIFLEGALPAQSQLLVADSTTEEEANEDSSADPAVVLASKMTLSVISLDSQEEENDEELARKSDLLEQADDEVLDESKYTTASGATPVEHDELEEEKTDNEDEIEEEIQKISTRGFVKNNILDFDDKTEYDTKEEDFEEDEPGAIFGIITSTLPVEHVAISAEDMEDIENLIDNVIDTGARVSEIISAENEEYFDEEGENAHAEELNILNDKIEQSDYVEDEK